MNARSELETRVGQPVQPKPIVGVDLRAFLMARRRALKLELQEIERLLELKPNKP